MQYCWWAMVQTKQPERNSGQSRTVGVPSGASKASSVLGVVLMNVLLRALALNQILSSSSGHTLCFCRAFDIWSAKVIVYMEHSFKFLYIHDYCLICCISY